MRIGRIDLDERVCVVAEIGNNHEGSVELAERLVGLAAGAGADAVKVQVFRTEAFVHRADAARFAQLKGFELAPADFKRLARAARRAGLAFIATPLDLDSAAVLEPLVDAYKIASADNTFTPLLEAVAASGRPVILSTGLATLEEVRAAVRALGRARGGLALLHCVSAYPAPPEQLNLRAIATLREQFRVPAGYSDHATGIEAAVLSVAAGARIIEKHFTIDRGYSGFRDHALSADPPQLAELVRRVRAGEAMLGDGAREPRPCERGTIPALRRSAVARRDLGAGAVVTAGDVLWLRGGGGVPPQRAGQLIGAKTAAPVAAGERIPCAG